MNSLIDVLQQWFLVVFLLGEVAIKLSYEPNPFSVPQDQERFDEISTRQRTAALSTASLVLVGIAIIFGNAPSELRYQIELFIASFGLLLIAAFSHQLTLTYEFVLTIQELSFEYGLLIMVYALLGLLHHFVPKAGTVALVVFASVLVIKILSVVGELLAIRTKRNVDG